MTETPTGEIRTFTGADADPSVKQFGTPGGLKPKQFRIDDDLFSAAPDLPAGTMIEMVSLFQEAQDQNVDMSRKLGLISKIFDMALFDESRQLLETRLHSKERPIGIRTLLDVIQWMMGEAYGLRPTQQPSPSTGSSDPAGAGSTAGAPPVESTPSPSPGAGSST